MMHQPSLFDDVPRSPQPRSRELPKTAVAGDELGELAAACEHTRIRHETKTHALCASCGVEMHPGTGKHYGTWVALRPGQRRTPLPKNGGRRG